MTTRPSKARRKPQPRASVARAKVAPALPNREDQTRRRKQAIRLQSGITRQPVEPQPTPADFNAAAILGRGRKGRKGIAIYMHPAAKDILDRIAHKHGRTVQDLGLEALNLLFLEYGEKPVA